jgi:hypothetical protein
MAPYVSMVGISVLALVGTIGLGRQVTAPHFIGGEWRVILDAEPHETSRCVASLAITRDPLLKIVQSGRYLSVTVGARNSAMNGVFDGERIHTTPPRDFGWPGTTKLVINARLERGSALDTLAGRIEQTGYPECEPLLFHASRESASVRAGR